MLSYCTMCDGFYNDPVKHRYIECPFYHGCPCGLKQQTRKHVDGCFMAKELKRKERALYSTSAVEAALKKKEAPLIRNSQSNVSLKCIYCFREYSYSRKEHEERYCTYFSGCPFCGAKKKDSHHVEQCKKKQIHDATGGDNDSGLYMICDYCRGDIEMDKWEGHRADCGPKSLSLIVDETVKNHKAAQAGRPTKWCWSCDKQICEDIFSGHQDECRKRMASRFSVLPKKENGELSVSDERPKDSHLKEAQFVEEP